MIRKLIYWLPAVLLLCFLSSCASVPKSDTTHSSQSRIIVKNIGTTDAIFYVIVRNSTMRQRIGFSTSGMTEVIKLPRTLEKVPFQIMAVPFAGYQEPFVTEELWIEPGTTLRINLSSQLIFSGYFVEHS